MKRGRRHRCEWCMEAIGRVGKMPVSQIAHELHTSEVAVYRVLRIHDVQPRGYERIRGIRVAWSVEAAEAYRAGATLEVIAAKQGVTRERVRQVLFALGVKMRRRTGHQCRPACAIVLAAAPPVHFLDLAKSSGLSVSVIAWAAQTHGIKSEGKRRHPCGERCERMRVALEEEHTTRAAMKRAGLLTPSGKAFVYGRMRVYHPEFRWAPTDWWNHRRVSAIAPDGSAT